MIPAEQTPTEAEPKVSMRGLLPGWLRIALSASAAVLAGLVLLAASLGLSSALQLRDTLPVETAVPLRADLSATAHERPQHRVIVHLRDSSAALAAYFRKLDYGLRQVRQDGAEVPRVYVPVLPKDLQHVQPIERRKSLFVRIVLPLVLKENERLRRDHVRLQKIQTELREGAKLGPEPQAWLERQYEDYNVQTGQFAKLLRRVDTIPPSLALAQAAKESAWGTSRFVREGNALFGMWTWSDDVPGIVPLERDEDARHRVRAFDSLAESVHVYMHMLNTHWAYREFRERRAAMRKAGRPPEGLALASAVSRYSQQRERYTVQLRALIRANDMGALDRTALGDDWLRSAVAAKRTAALGNTAMIAQEPGR
ncbi:MAG TPA: glucosaminidase domain-containing protein [bacterium]|nr:glucosaminidase domain-containing protein [bacterium]